MGGSGRGNSNNGSHDNGSWDDDGWADDGWADAAVDDAVRARLHAALPADGESHRVLTELQPRLRRARRRHQANRLLVGVSAGLMILAGVGLVANQLSSGPDNNLIATGPDPADNGGRLAEGVAASSTTNASDTAAQDPAPPEDDAGSGPTGQGDPATAPEGDGEGTDADPGTPPVPTPPVSPTSPTTNAPPGAPPTTTLDYDCGSLVLTVDGPAVLLVDTLPASGARADIKNAGPEEVEVGFEGAGHHCEIRAAVIDGALQTSIHDEDDDSDERDD